MSWLFGAGPPTTGGGLFGAAPTPAPGGGLFGAAQAPAAASGSFGGGGGGGNLLGRGGAAGAPAPAFGGLGPPAAGNPFGGAGPGVFGPRPALAPAAAAFGAPVAGGLFGAKAPAGGLFGGAAPAPACGLFGIAGNLYNTLRSVYLPSPVSSSSQGGVSGSGPVLESSSSAPASQWNIGADEAQLGAPMLTVGPRRHLLATRSVRPRKGLRARCTHARSAPHRPPPLIRWVRRQRPCDTTRLACLRARP